MFRLRRSRSKTVTKPVFFLVNSRPDEFDDGNVMAGLAPGPEPVAEHESQGGFQHCFVGLLKTSLIVKGEDFLSRS
jgi:hypothetical protein